MVGGKKWLVVLTEEQHEWIKRTSEEVGIKGSDIVREIIDRVMADNPRQFKNSMANAQLKIRLQALNDKRAAIEEEANELKKQMSGREKQLA